MIANAREAGLDIATVIADSRRHIPDSAAHPRALETGIALYIDRNRSGYTPKPQTHAAFNPVK